MASSKRFDQRVVALTFTLAVGGCSANYQAGDGGVEPGSCAVDEDQDGYGLGCAAGPDCNDADPSMNEGCAACSQPETGCACEEGSAPVDCIEQSLLDDDTLLCKAGTRYCRDGRWSACESIKQFTAEVPRRTALGTGERALLPDPPGTESCSPCNPNCFPVTDLLETVDGGLDSTNSENIEWVPGGGITIVSEYIGPPTISTTSECIPGSCGLDQLMSATCDEDCDGIPNLYDLAVNNKPFGTTVTSIFMDLPVGETGSVNIDLQFYLRTADIYFLMDTSSTMATELAQLVDDMTDTTDDGTSLLSRPDDCADLDRDGDVDADDNAWKSKGIVGSLKCRARDAYIGAGWFREIPFGQDASSSTGLQYGDDASDWPSDLGEFAYENAWDLDDMSSDADLSAFQSAVASFVTNPNYEGPNAGLLALHLAVTQGGSYVGWERPGIPPKTNCVSTTFGYPCFRNDAYPIIVLVTDEPLYNGPMPTSGDLGSTSAVSSVPVTYPSDILGSMRGTTQAYWPTSANDARTDAWPVGDISQKLETYVGDTRGFNADVAVAATEIGCTVTTAAVGPDAFFRFRVPASAAGKPLTISSRGTRFDSVVGTFGMVTTTTTTTTEEVENGGNCPDDPTAPPGEVCPVEVDVSLGEADDAPMEIAPEPLVSPVNKTLTGTLLETVGQSYPREMLGPECYDHSAQSGNQNKSEDLGPDLIFSFQLSDDFEELTFDLSDTAKSSFALFDKYPNAPTPKRISYSSSTVELGTIDGAAYRIVGPDSDDDLIETGSLPNASIAGSPFAATGCDNVGSGGVNGLQVKFDVAADGTDVKIELTGEGNGLEVTKTGNNSGIGSAIGIVQGVAVAASPDTTLTANGACESKSAADATAACQLAETDIKGKWVQINGSLAAFDSSDGSDPADVPASYQGTLAAGATGTSNCGSTQDGRDAVFRITPTTTGTYQFDTEGSAATVSTYLSLHKAFPLTLDTGTFEVDGDPYPQPFPADATPYTLSPTARHTITFTGSTLDASSNVEDAQLGGCMPVNNSTDQKDEQLRFHLDTASTVTLQVWDNGQGDTFKPAAALFKVGTSVQLDSDGSGSANDASLDDDDSIDCVQASLWTTTSPQTPGTLTFTNLAAGDYSIVVTNGSTGAGRTGDYKVQVSVPASNAGNTQACDHGSTETNHSKLTAQLTAGETYYVVVKGANTSQTGNFTLNITDKTDSGSTTALYACSECEKVGNQMTAGCMSGDGSAKYASELTLNDLAAGSYTVWLRPTNSSHNNVQFRALVRDLAYAPEPVERANGKAACVDSQPKQTQVDEFTLYDMPAEDANGNTITYYIVYRGFSADDTGTFDIRVYNTSGSNATTTTTTTDTNSVCRQEVANNGEITTTFEVPDGQEFQDYFAFVKGIDANDEGIFQVTFGDTTLEQNMSYAPVDWTTVAGELDASNVRVIGINTSDDPTSSRSTALTEQLEVIAAQTDALNFDGTPLVAEVPPAEVGSTAVRLVETLSWSLKSDVSIRLVKEPDDPNGSADDFNFYVTAVDSTDDGCVGEDGEQTRNEQDDPLDPKDDQDDTHVGCSVGATPKFVVEFENPVDHPVGCKSGSGSTCVGYEMRIELITNEQFVIERIPVYIIPEELLEDDPYDLYEPTGEYFQDFGTPNCLAGERPDWTTLNFTAAVPPEGGELSWDVCVAGTESELDDCDAANAYTTVATVFSDGTACTSDADCVPLGGTCSTQFQVCQFVTGPNCGSDADCGAGGTCDGGQCTWLEPPMDVGALLPPGQNGLPYMRVRASLTAATDLRSAPIVYDWEVQYECAPTE